MDDEQNRHRADTVAVLTGTAWVVWHGHAISPFLLCTSKGCAAVLKCKTPNRSYNSTFGLSLSVSETYRSLILRELIRANIPLPLNHDIDLCWSSTVVMEGPSQGCMVPLVVSLN